MILNITNVEYLGDYSLLYLFNNGKKKKMKLTSLLSYPAFEELEDKRKFVQSGPDGTIFLSNGAAISPEYVFEHGVNEI